MQKLRLLIATLLILCAATSAQALTLPDLHRHYFTGSTTELLHIRAGIAKIAGYPSTSWTFPGAEVNEYGVIGFPMGMGAVDCMDSYYVENQGPYDGSEDYLGMSTTVIVNGELVGVEIPTLEDLTHQGDLDFPGECTGYLFYQNCVETGIMASLMCPDPV